MKRRESKSITRRDLLLAGGAGLAAAAGLAPRTGFTEMLGTSGPFDDYRALVCVFLFGGNDSFNMLVPRSPAEYGVYQAARQNLAIPQAALLPITPLTQDGAEYGVHPAMPGLRDLFETERAAFVTNVGPLFAPTTKEQYLANSVPLPPQLFSHNDQQDQWHSLRSGSSNRSGWAGRIADMLRANVTNQQLATNISLRGTNLFQAGDATISYIMGARGPMPFLSFQPGGPYQAKLRSAFERLVDARYESMYERAFAEVQQRALRGTDRLTEALAGVSIGTPFPPSELGQQLRTVARMLAVRDRFEMKRQIFFVASPGFDSHDDQVAVQPGLLGNVSACLRQFYAATVELGVASSVTTFTQSDFGRTLTSNGDGSDHAWGGNQIVMGDAVRGRMLYGTYPRLELDGPDDVGGGRLIPTTSADQYAATLARWFGIADADLDRVAPHLAGFEQRNLGFML
jgi:uncharacterized protein (DUF1501 family)